MASLAVEETVAFSAEMAAVHRSRRRRWALIVSVSVGGIALSLLLGWFLLVREQALTEVQFKLDAGERIESLQRTVSDRVGVLDTVAAFFFGSQLVDRNEFHTFASPLIARYPGLELLAWVPRIPVAQRQAHEEAARNEGPANYQIAQRDSQGQLVAAENRDTYFPMQFIEAPDQDQSLLGFDLASDPACRRAIEHVTATGQQAAVVCPRLDGSDPRRSLLYVVTPVWQENGNPTKIHGDIAGFVLGVFRVRTIVEAALSLFPPTEIGIYFTGLVDANGKSPIRSRLFPLFPLPGHEDSEEPPIAPVSPPEGGMHERHTIDVAKNDCTLDCVPLGAYLSRQRTWGPLSALLAGLVITGLSVGYLFLLTGRTQHVEQLEAERAAELQSVSNTVLDAVILMDAHGQVAHWNPAAERIFGYSYDEIVGRCIHDTLIPARYQEAAKKGMQAFTRSGQGPFVGKVLELEALRNDGSEFPVEISVSPVLLEGGWGAVAIVRDVTSRKRAEETLHREQQLLRDMLDLHERDRKLVAYEIHDGLAQQLTAALYRFQAVEMLRDRNPIEGRETFDEGLRLLRQAMIETRRLISGLRPPVLDELGVVAAIECLIGEQQQTGCPEIEFIHGSELDRLAPPLESAVFRIVQECLTNACRYSQSKKIRVELGQSEGRVRIDVQDWGIGFNPDEVEGDHFGLRGINERAQLLGGNVTVKTAPHEGTRITVELPLIVQADDGTV